MEIEEYVPLAPLTTFHIGGMARYFCRVESVEELQECLDWLDRAHHKFARDQNQGVLILGGGSNVLIRDEGFDGLVIKMEIGVVEIGIDEKGEGEGKKLLIAGAGESWDGLVLRAVKEGLWGIENLSGIPGTVGGGVVQNIGAYGAALSEVLEWVEVFDVAYKEKKEGMTSAIRRMYAHECRFDYRDSIFKHKDTLVVLRAAFRLSHQPNPNLLYKDLASRFNRPTDDTQMYVYASREALKAPKMTTDTALPQSLSAVREVVLEIRRDKFPDLSKEGTAGSFFKNPILSRGAASILAAAYPLMPLFPLPESGGVKVPLAWLLDHELGLKGFASGGARLFEKQPLVIATTSTASSRDVEALAQAVAQKVQKHFSITIEPEVRIIK